METAVEIFFFEKFTIFFDRKEGRIIGNLSEKK